MAPAMRMRQQGEQGEAAWQRAQGDGGARRTTGTRRTRSTSPASSCDQSRARVVLHRPARDQLERILAREQAALAGEHIETGHDREALIVGAAATGWPSRVRGVAAQSCATSTTLRASLSMSSPCA